MNRNKLKTYAPKARRDFIAAVTARAIKFGISKDAIEPVQVQGNIALIAGQAHPRKVADQRLKLEARVKTRGFEQVMEEAAYTWFNRFAAIRYMEVHGYLDHGYRVLSHPEGKATPEIVEHAQHLDLPGLDKEKVIELKLDGTKEGDLYRMLLMAQCNALNSAMPFLFERIDDETELLLPDNLLHSDSVIRQMVIEIEEADWQEIEIIGWLYQFYISEKKDQVIGKVVKSEDIPAATQLFTPNWIVKYMVQNTLGAKWLATYPQSGIRAKMEFYIEPAEQTDGVNTKLAEITPKELNPEEITFLDPACGSGHILVEAYDLFKDIYLERGYVLRDVPRLILEKNLFGLDVDDRAAQMAAFALLMKARNDDRRILEKHQKMNVKSILSSKKLNIDDQKIASDSNKFELIPSDDLLPETIQQPMLSMSAATATQTLAELVAIFRDADSIGSLTKIPERLLKRLPILRNLAEKQLLSRDRLEDSLAAKSAFFALKLIDQAETLSMHFDCVAANPPYIGNRAGMNDTIKQYAQDYFNNARGDTFSMFVARGLEFCRTGYMSMVTLDSWLTLSTYEYFRSDILNNSTILSLAHMPYEGKKPTAMGINFGVACFTLRGVCSKYMGYFIRQRYVDLIGDGSLKSLSAFTGLGKRIDGGQFLNAPANAIVYGLSDQGRRKLFSATPLRDLVDAREGMATAGNDRFLRWWHEVPYGNIAFNINSGTEAVESGSKWFPYNKGGEYKRWFGNIGLIVNWENDGLEIKGNIDPITQRVRSHNYNGDYAFLPGLTWTSMSSKGTAARIMPNGFMFDAKGPMAFGSQETINFAAALMNSVVGRFFLSSLSATKDFKIGHILALPVEKSMISKNSIHEYVNELWGLAKNEWASFETSWEFQSPPLISGHCIKNAFVEWQAKCHRSYSRSGELQRHVDEELVDEYGLAEELGDKYESGEITLYIGDNQSDVFWLASYSIGCMMGRYSLDEPGLIYANSGNVGFDPSRYTTFPADDDGIVPIMQADWFDDDATNRVVEFIKVAWSPETLAENLKFVADSLGTKSGETPIDTIRRYLSTDFFKDHLKTYKKRPIYWLFSSGKEKAFEALVYLHRYNEGTLSRMRMEYVTPLQGRIASKIDQLGRDIDAAASTAAQNKLRKEQEKLKKQQAELVKFDEELRHYADMRIKLDLDDGVKVNYGKFGTLLAETKAITGGSEE
ncbi:BREX-1 system adenine-specific DNA-methyltransferase PglX [Paramagnetospirillum magneticum]|uniref:site-specific DNA-methyltransferase (adenine-specific) n=1 Tax=Paramagnetospirillum magneticum (strain ATCC 700264 / AMB-1) TaxID=342108 RepID=Q2W5M7_PARM1|nr:BREX-1 system adenine-specific DNA-methyltransferase PglX [Paramagnetospirillum magneticum]BAE50848.1 Type II restriction enzyme [Paramagnetospirillum magneticum AMB-1]